MTADNPLGNLIRYRSHPLPFLSECILTIDQTDKLNPIKPFPAHFPYIPPVLDRLMSERFLIIRKSRRMVMSWTVLAFCLWDALFHIGRAIFVVSSKEEKSDELVRRAEFMYKNIPPDKLPAKPRADYRYCRLSFAEIDSFIQGVPQGADQLRQPTISRIVGDEFAFWEKAEETYGAMRPAVEGGGQIVLLSSSFPGFFKKLVEDETA